MDLLEYQAKQLFQQVGIPVLPSQSILDPSELKDLHIPYPVVLKSQVRASGRAKVGGVKFVENTIDAIAAAQSIFHLAIENEYPEVILAESRYDVQDELFLAIMFDYQLKKPVLLASSAGGIHIENLLENLQTCVIEHEFSPFYGRYLAKKIGFSGKTILAISSIFEKMYDLFVNEDLEVIEINPLGINSKGDVMALDGKIRVNDEALARHPHLLELIRIHSADKEMLNTQSNPFDSPQKLTSFEVNKNANLVIIANSIDSAIFSTNQVLDKKGEVNHCFILSDYLSENIISSFENIINYIIESPEIEIVLVNLIADTKINNKIKERLIKYYQDNFFSSLNIAEDRLERPTGKRIKSEIEKKSNSAQIFKKVRWFLRVIDNNHNEIPTIVTDLPIEITDNLETAITEIVEIQTKKVKSTRNNNQK